MLVFSRGIGFHSIPIPSRHFQLPIFEGFPVKILILPDSFKGSLTSSQAAAQIESAARKVFPEAQIESFPIADGGEGTLEMVQKAAGGAFLPIEVMGPCGQRVRSRYLSIGDTAVVELAEAAGLGLRLPGFSPMKTTTIGVGQIIAEALHVGPPHRDRSRRERHDGLRLRHGRRSRDSVPR